MISVLDNSIVAFAEEEGGRIITITEHEDGELAIMCSGDDVPMRVIFTTFAAFYEGIAGLDGRLNASLTPEDAVNLILAGPDGFEERIEQFRPTKGAN